MTNNKLRNPTTVSEYFNIDRIFVYTKYVIEFLDDHFNQILIIKFHSFGIGRPPDHGTELNHIFGGSTGED